MKKLKIPLKKYYEIFYSVCIALGLLLLADRWFEFSSPKPLLLISALAVQILLYWSEEKNLRLPVGISVIALAAAIGIILSLSNKDLDKYFIFIGMLLLCAAADILAYIARNRLWLKATCIIFEVSAIVYLSIRRISLPKWTVCIILLCLILLLAEISQKASGSKSKNNFLYLTPIFAAVMIPMLLLPSKNTPIQWTLVKKAISAVNERINALIVDVQYLFSDGGDFSVAVAGYGSSSKLKGNLNSSDKPMITITGTKTKAPVYLAGTVYNSYNGSGWEHTDESKPYEAAEYLMQRNGIYKALSQSIYTVADTRELTNSCRFEIKYDGLKTKSLFLPSNIYRIDLGSKIKTKESGGSMSLRKAQGVGFSYSFNFDEVDWGNEKIQNLLRQKAWRNTPVKNAEEQAREDYIYKNYTVLPDSISNRVYELADKITHEQTSDYDRLKAIELYLKQFTYTTSPGSIPKNKEFTDYFLFESQKGYCTYFATSMAVLARCEGIPARYVEGFVTDETCNYYNKEIVVEGNSAHAWVEAYIENIGWVTFDPTPGYYDLSAGAWTKPASFTATESDSFRPEDLPLTSPNSQTENTDGSEGGNPAIKTILTILCYTVLILSALTALTALLVFLRNIFRKRKYFAESDYGKAMFLMKKILACGKLYGFAPEDGETLFDYNLKINGCLDTGEKSFEFICGIFQGIRFGNSVVKKDDLSCMERYTLSVEKQYRAKCHFFKRLICILR